MTEHVGVVFGGPSPEAEVSRASGEAVLAALREAGYTATLIELTAELPRFLGQVDVAFPVTHGPLGEDGCLQGLLEVLDVPYVGSGVLASALAADKVQAKVAFRAAGLPIADEVTVEAGASVEQATQAIQRRLGDRVVIKPRSGGSAIGVTRVLEWDEGLVKERLRQALSEHSHVLVERFYDGFEVTCAVTDFEGSTLAMPPTLVRAKAAEWYDFRSRYATGGSEHSCPAPFETSILDRVQDVARQAHEALGARDMSRADFVVAPDGAQAQVTLLEVNTLPGMTATSLFPEAVGVAGTPFVELCRRLVQTAMARGKRSMPSAMPMPL